ncbi:MAG: adenylosuccinate synthetase [Ruminococcus sp.]|nr:adenylosuccinate synthetase [Ruminococcus sp.]
MVNVKVVTGASYGDEGKGLMTAYFSAKAKDGKCLNILHNGGGQRGHTVKRGNVRHVFHHLGSGTFEGAATYFSEDFILNPIIFAEEMNSPEIPDNTAVYRNASCRWSTPYDMMINRIAEDFRGNNRHGSCGAGIWETVLRYQSLPCPPIDEFTRLPEREQRDFLREVKEYGVNRLREEGVEKVPEKWRESMESEGLTAHFLRDVKYMTEQAAAVKDIPKKFDEIVFEGGQGLMLSENLMELCGSDKHLTPSFTGHENPVKLIGKMTDVTCVEVCYVTRTYLTRHGAGPFPGECPKEEINPGMTDLTNIPNDCQGTLRYGKADMTELNRRISRDFSGYKALAGVPSIIRSAAITHMNETGGMIAVQNGKAQPAALTADRIYLSWSENVNEINEF